MRDYATAACDIASKGNELLDQTTKFSFETVSVITNLTCLIFSELRNITDSWAMSKSGADFKVLWFTLVLGMGVFAFGQQCNPRRKVTYTAENRALEGFTYARKPVRSRVICERVCSLEARCKSFNFNDCNKMCELNLATRGEHPGNFSEIQGSVYSDEDADTPRYSLNDTNGCRILHNGKSLQ